MRAALSMLLVLAVALAFSGVAQAEDKAVTLKGTLTCAKCDLGKETKCMTVLVVSKDGKDTVYYLDAKNDKANHKDICKAPKKDVSITGTVAEKDGKHTISVSKIDGLK